MMTGMPAESVAFAKVAMSVALWPWISPFSSSLRTAVYLGVRD